MDNMAKKVLGRIMNEKYKEVDDDASEDIVEKIKTKPKRKKIVI